MPAHNAITPDKLDRLVALPGSPRIIDMRDAPAEAIPGSLSPAGDDRADGSMTVRAAWSSWTRMGDAPGMDEKRERENDPFRLRLRSDRIRS